MKWIWQKQDWPNFTWEAAALLPWLSKARFEQGKLLAQIKGLGFELGQEAGTAVLIEEVIKTSEIEKKAIIQNPSKGRSTSYDLNWNTEDLH